MSALVFEDFQPHAGSTFTLNEEGAPALALVLEETERLPELAGRPEGMRPPYSLIFRCANPPILPQQLYRLSHPDMGDLTIFLVPIGQDSAGVIYQAVFN